MFYTKEIIVFLEFCNIIQALKDSMAVELHISQIQFFILNLILSNIILKGVLMNWFNDLFYLTRWFNDLFDMRI